MSGSFSGVAHVHDAEARVERRIQVVHVDLVGLTADEVLLAEREHRRRLLDLIPRQHRRLREEGRDGRVGQRRDRAIQRVAAQTRIQAGRATAGQADLRLAVRAVGERERVARIDKVRVLDLRIDDPDLGPQPRVFQEQRGDVPERVTALDGVALGGIGANQRAGAREAPSL